MGNNYSQDKAMNFGERVASTGVRPPLVGELLQNPSKGAATRAALVMGTYIPTRINYGEERMQQLHKTTGRTRTSVQTVYRPRSASLRRRRSIQNRRFLEGVNTKGKLSAKSTAKVEAEYKKLQEKKALLAACARGDLSQVEKLVDSGVDVNTTDENQMTALHYAAMHARDDVIKYLISRGAQVKKADKKEGFSAMHWVVNSSVPKYGSTDSSLTALTEAGCRVNTTDYNFATPLHIASRKGNRDGVEVLLKLGADPDEVDITGRNCFDVAKNEQMKTYMKTLLENSSKKDNNLESERIYHVLEDPLSSIPAPLLKRKHIYNIPDAPLPSIQTPFPPLLPPRLVCIRKSSREEHMNSINPGYSPPSPSSLRLRSVTPPPIPRRRCRYPLNGMEAQLYHVLEPIPTSQSMGSSPPKRKRSRRH